MKGNKLWKRLMAAGLVCAMAAGMLTGNYAGNAGNRAEAATQNIGVDINGNQNRGNLKSSLFEDWTIDQPCQSVSHTSGDVTFTLSNQSGQGSIIGGQYKRLVTDTQSPLLTCDGVSFKDVVSGGALKLEIEGLTEGTHTLTTWHSMYEFDPEISRSTMTIMVNGQKEVEGLVIPSRVSEDKDAAIVYTSFTVKEGGKVTVLFTADGNGTEYDIPVLNAFEIDGVVLEKAISNPTPAEQELHYEVENGLNWKAADGAVAHEVYLGTDENELSAADRGSDTYMGKLTDCHFSLDGLGLSHMNRYYWRVDEVFDDGSVVRGRVMWFEPAHLAFPGAEGYGRYAKGGRGGRVIEVTNLNDSGPGSLREAVEEEKGARIIVFRVGGVIELESRLKVPADGGNVYIAGQTAPGDGITLTKHAFGIYYAKDVIIRDVRLRVGDSNGISTDGMGMAGADHCIVDHCSIAWTTDEGTSSRGAQNITFQRNLIAEALNNSVHYDADNREDTERHSFAGSISGNIGSFHHNLLVNCTGRNWSMAGGVESDGKTYGGKLDIRNNVIYNYRDRTTDGGARRVQFVGNYYKKGAVSNDMKIFTIDGDELGTGDMQMAYVSGNMLVNKDGSVILDADDDAWAKNRVAANSKFGAKESQVRSDVPFFESYVTTQRADEAYASVVSDVGATVPKQDYLDARYVQETIKGTYTYKGSRDGLKGIIDSQDDVGGYPVYETCTDAPDDSDHDGMPDEWEKEHGLNPNYAEDGKELTLSKDGYTNVEMYLNELAGDEVNYNPYEPWDEMKASPVPSIEPQASESASAKPQASESASIEPQVSESASAKPQASENASAKPQASESASAKPQASESASAKPQESESASAKPQASESALTKPQASESASTEPQASESASTEPQVSESASTKPQESESASAKPYESQEPFAAGDVNGDGRIGLDDAQIILRAAIKLKALTEEQKACADVDGNGTVNIRDAQLVLKKALKLIDDYINAIESDVPQEPAGVSEDAAGGIVVIMMDLTEEILDKCREVQYD